MTSVRSLLRVALAAAFTLVAGSAAGCGDSSAAATGAAAGPSTMASSVVQIRTSTGVRGTGFAISYQDHTLVATAAHVVADASEVSILREQPIERTQTLRTIYPDVRVRAIDFVRDLAVLEVPNLPAGTLQPLAIDGERCSDASRAWGYPPTVFTSNREQGITETALSGVKAVRLNAEESLGGQQRVLARDAVAGIVFTPALENGNSGGPVMAGDGTVVGVTVMKSLLHSQGAAVCASELMPLLDQAVASPEPDGPAMERFASDVLNTFLPFVEDAESAQAARDFLLPSIIEQCRDFYLQFLSRLSSAPGGLRFGDLRSAFDQAFPGTFDRVERLQDRCLGQDTEKMVQCIADIAALPMALALFRKPLGDLHAVRSVQVKGEPRRVVQDPPEYEVALLATAAGGDRSLRVRFRQDYGRLWLVPPGPEETFLAAVRGDAAAPFVGTWSHQIEQAGDDGRQSNGTYTLLVRQLGGAITVSGALHVQHLAPPGQTFPCNGQRRVEVDYRATWSARPRGNRLVLELVSEQKLRDAARCQVSDQSMELEKRDDELVIVGRNGEPGYAGVEWRFDRRGLP